jgi:phage baseplate assembly protein W
MERLYSIPYNFDLLSKKGSDLSGNSLFNSIAQNVNLIITSKFGSHRFNANYGCIIWNKDFEILEKNMKWEEEISNSIKDSILHNETRIEQVRLNTTFAEVLQESAVSKVKAIKKVINIEIRGVIKQGGQEFVYRKSLFVSPIILE